MRERSKTCQRFYCYVLAQVIEIMNHKNFIIPIGLLLAGVVIALEAHLMLAKVLLIVYLTIEAYFAYINQTDMRFKQVQVSAVLITAYLPLVLPNIHYSVWMAACAFAISAGVSEEAAPSFAVSLCRLLFEAKHRGRRMWLLVTLSIVGLLSVIGLQVESQLAYYITLSTSLVGVVISTMVGLSFQNNNKEKKLTGLFWAILILGSLLAANTFANLVNASSMSFTIFSIVNNETKAIGQAFFGFALLQLYICLDDHFSNSGNNSSYAVALLGSSILMALCFRVSVVLNEPIMIWVGLYLVMIADYSMDSSWKDFTLYGPTKSVAKLLTTRLVTGRKSSDYKSLVTFIRVGFLMWVIYVLISGTSLALGKVVLFTLAPLTMVLWAISSVFKAEPDQ